MSTRTMLVRTVTTATVTVTAFGLAAPAASAASGPTVSATCVSPYAPAPNVGVTNISWSGAPSGAQVKVTGFVTDYRPASTPTGTVALPGLPLDKSELESYPGHEGYQAYLIDSAGVVIAGPVGLTLCAPTPPKPTNPAPGSCSFPSYSGPARTYWANGVRTKLFVKHGQWYVKIGKNASFKAKWANCGNVDTVHQLWFTTKSGKKVVLVVKPR